MDIMNGFVQEIEAKSGQPIGRCYQCAKCTAGCPTVKWFDWPNHGVIRKVQMGAKDELLASRAIWMCIGVRDLRHALPQRHLHLPYHGRAAQHGARERE